MRSPRRISLSLLTSGGIVTALAAVGLKARGLVPGDTVDDQVEIPLELVGVLAVFIALVTLFSLVRERSLRWIALASVGAGVTVVVSVAAWRYLVA